MNTLIKRLAVSLFMTAGLLSNVSCSSSDDDNQSNVSQDPAKLALIQEGIRRVGTYEQDINQGYLLSSMREQEKQMVEDHLHWIKVALYRLRDDLENRDAGEMLSDRVKALSDSGFMTSKDIDSFRDLIDFFTLQIEPILNLEVEPGLQVFEESFDKTLGSFTSFSAKGGKDFTINDKIRVAVANGNFGSSEVETWLISPVFDLNELEEPKFKFRQGIGFGKSWAGLDVLISENFVGGNPNASEVDWAPLEITQRPAFPDLVNKNWSDFEDSQQISLESYFGKKVVIAFRYNPPTDAQPAWQIDHFELTGVGLSVPDTIPLTGMGTGTGGKQDGDSETPADKTFVKRITPGADKIYYKALEGSVADLGFKEFSVKGKYVWRAYKDKKDGNRPVGLSMSGFNDKSGDNHDWLISPVIDLSTAKDPYLQIVDRIKFLNNNPLSNLKVKVSNNYSGDPEDPAVTWKTLNVRGNSPEVDKFVVSGKIPLTDFIGDTIVIGFEYEGTPKASISWAVAEILVSE